MRRSPYWRSGTAYPGTRCSASSTAACWARRFTRYKSAQFVRLDYAPTFTTRLLRKDFDLGLEAARESRVPMPVAALVAELIQAADGAGHAGEDFAALLARQAEGAGLTLEPEDVAVDDGLDPNGG